MYILPKMIAKFKTEEALNIISESSSDYSDNNINSEEEHTLTDKSDNESNINAEF
ncbi:MAG: hypothetical protein MHPSP_000296 [Paramarteilia canceri]